MRATIVVLTLLATTTCALAAAPSASAVLLPDLVTTSITNPPALRNRGTTYSQKFAVMNIDRARARSSTARIFLSLDRVKGDGDRVVRNISISWLGVHQTSVRTASVIIPNNLAPSLYHVIVCADARRAVRESGEGNNCRASKARMRVDIPPSPPVPALVGTTPTSPGSDPTPIVNGTAAAGNTVSVFTNGTCAGTATRVVTVATANFAIQLTTALPLNQATQLSARAKTAASNPSACSGPLTYEHDGIAPSVPTINLVQASPSNDPTPVIGGLGSAGDTVRVYDAASNPLCAPAGASLGEGIVVIGGTWSIALTTALDLNGSYTFVAAEQDLAGNTSSCSAPSTAYLYDTTVPSTPIFLGPSSPANDTTPQLLGQADANTTVALYANGTCSEPPIALAGALDVDDFTNQFTFTHTVPANSTTTFSAKADRGGSSSPCSNPFAYIEDSASPTAPTLTGTNPVSPANNASPLVLGAASDTVTLQVLVEIFVGAGCGGAVVASDYTDVIDNFAIAVPVTLNATTALSARAKDDALNIGGCSGTISYTHDNVSATPTIASSSPATAAGSPSNDTTPDLTGTADASATVNIFTDNTCTSAVAGTGIASGGGAFTVNATAAANGTTTFYAKATDTLGNTSSCSSGFNYHTDTIAPTPPTITSSTPTTAVGTPSQDTTPDISGTSEIAATVAVYTNSTCNSAVAGSTTANGAGTFTALGAVAAANGTTTFYATATDGAGNVSGCSTTAFNYFTDTAAPGAPTITSSSPATAASTPSMNTSPTISGSAEASSTVRIYTNSSCTSAVAGSGAASGGGGFSIGVTGAAANGTTTYYARATDFAGNVGGCSLSAFNYFTDNTAPTAGTITGPVSGGSLRPTLVGTAEASATVKAYTASNCLSGLVGQGPATGGNFSITITANANNPNTTTNYYTTATDVAGNVSACSVVAFTYTHDSSKAVTSSNFSFTPGALSAPANSNVLFTNVSGTHNVFSDGPDFFPNSPSPLTSYTVAFAAAGTYGYHCTIHGLGMSGTITVP